MTEKLPALPGQMEFFDSHRQDAWWAGPLLTAAGLLAFIVYASWAAFQGDNYRWGPYHSPFYSPLIVLDWWPLSPAFLIIWIPAGFRLTCYYFRKAYYRSLFLTPPACWVGAKPQNYRGERAWLVFQNLHRYFLYLALVVLGVHFYDLTQAFWFDGHFGVGGGSLVIMLDVAFLGAYIFGCNSLRHLVGGNVNCFSCASLGTQRRQAWKITTMFNLHHRGWAWVSLIWVGLTDLYIRLLAMGLITDIRFI
ncbi:MAG: succinate dehydrogenase [Deltaproteobacteria bacterium]|nr:succinate dehydrogenase [Deltaproteobacteria bacterium]